MNPSDVNKKSIKLKIKKGRILTGKSGFKSRSSGFLLISASFVRGFSSLGPI